MSHVMNTYARLPVAFTHGEGVWLYDDTGKRYLDALSGIAVQSTLGHTHPRLVKAIAEQAAKRVLTPPTSIAFRCRSSSPTVSRRPPVWTRCSSATRAVRPTRQRSSSRACTATTRAWSCRTIIVMESAFHGRTMATLSATGNRKTQAGFEPLVQGFIRVPYKDIEAVRSIAQHNRNVVAVLLEMIQGEGGVNMADEEFQRDLRAICDDKGWLMMCDEVQCGMGRTGKWYGWQHAGTRPDVMTLAKGLASGVPIGACVTAGNARGLFGPGNHGSTFGGNPLACAAGLATLDTIVDDKLMDNAIAIGDLIRKSMAEALADVAGVVDIRGQGLMIGIELDRPCGELMGRAAEQGLLLSVTADRVIRLLPALTFSADEAQTLVSMLAPMIRDFLANG